MNISRMILAASAAALLFAGHAYAADAVVAVDDTPTTYNWSGLYVLGNVGYGSGHSDYEHQNVNNFGGTGGTYENSGNGFEGGGAVGYNLAFTNGFVVGIEGAVRTGANLDDGGEFEIYHNTTFTDPKIVYNVTGKVGYAMGSFLPYAKAGWAGGTIEARQDYHPGGTPTTWSDKKFANGFVIGGGVDYAVTDNFFVGAEYNYTQFGKVSFSGVDSFGKETDISGKFREHTFLVHAGYKF